MSVRLDEVPQVAIKPHSKLYGVLWRLAEAMFVSNMLQRSSRLRVFVLRLFGATIGSNCLIMPFRVRHPYNLSIGDRCWIGEGVWIYNRSQLSISPDSVVGQQSFICTGSHDLDTMIEVLAPITIGASVMLSVRTILISGTIDMVIGDGVVVIPGSVITRSLIGATDGSRVIYGGNPVRKLRELSSASE